MGQAFISRRALLALSATSLLRAQSGKGATSVYPPHHFLDSATEFDLFRLTDPQVTSVMTSPHLRSMSKRGRFLVYAGNSQVYRLDWRNGESRSLAAPAALDPRSLALVGDDRSVLFFDGPVLKQVSFSGLREREIGRVTDGWERDGFSVSADGSRMLWPERRGGQSRVMSPTGVVLEKVGAITDVQVRPSAPAELFYRLDGKPRFCGAGGQDRPVAIEAGGTMGQELWSSDGQTLLYLWNPVEPRQLVTLREYAVEGGSDRLVSKTSQFGSFGVNADGSVFVGASRSLASPYVLLLVRAVKRELTLCEHRSSDPRTVNPVFSPDSQSVFFVSDRQGKPAIYRAHVDKFVEETE